MVFKSIKRYMKDDDLTYEEALDRYTEDIDRAYDMEKDRRFEESLKKK